MEDAVEANQCFLHQQRAEIDKIFASSESGDEPELPQAPICPEPDTEIVNISGNE